MMNKPPLINSKLFKDNPAHKNKQPPKLTNQLYPLGSSEFENDVLGCKK